jgi:replicative DNA helicase
MTEDKLTLHNKDLECQILSNLMNYVNLYTDNREHLNADLFYYPVHRTVFEAIKDVYESGDVPDVLTVGMYLMQNPRQFAPDPAELSIISEFASTSVNFFSELMMLVDMAKRRRCWLLGQRMIKAGTDFTVDISEIDKDIEIYREDNYKSAVDYYDMKAINGALSERVQQNTVDEKANMVTTGFMYLDIRGCFQFTDLIVIAGATSMGKTTLAINMLVSNAKAGIPSMFFSLEMTIQQLSARINAPICGISSSLLLFKKLRTSQLRDFEKAKAVSNDLPIYIDDSANSIEAIKEKIRSMAIKKGVKVFYIDFLQRVKKPKNMRESEASFYEAISNDLKDLAKELKVCIVILCQLNRDANNTDPRPTLSKIKASSGIEQAADTVVFIYRPGYYGKQHKYRPTLDADKSAEIIIAKAGIQRRDLSTSAISLS